MLPDDTWEKANLGKEKLHVSLWEKANSGREKFHASLREKVNSMSFHSSEISVSNEWFPLC